MHPYSGARSLSSAVLHWLTNKKIRQKDTPKATQEDWLRQAFDILTQMTVPKSQILSQQLPEHFNFNQSMQWLLH